MPITKKIALITTIFSLSSVAFANTTTLADQDCVVKAQEKFKLAEEDALSLLMEATEKCDVRGISDYVDKCYAIGSRNYQRDLVLATQNYQKDLLECASHEKDTEN